MSIKQIVVRTAFPIALLAGLLAGSPGGALADSESSSSGSSSDLGASAAQSRKTAAANCHKGTVYFRKSQFQFDNCAGNGAAWIWLWTSGDNTRATADVKYASGRVLQWETRGNQAATANEWSLGNITSVKICDYYTVGWFPPLPAHTCSVETSV